MTKKDYIDQKRFEIQNSYTQISEKHNLKDILSSLVFLATSISGVMVISSNIDLAYALGLISALSISYKFRNSEKYNNTYDKIDGELSHLREKQREEETEDSNNKKLYKIIELNKSRIKKERKYDDAITLTNLTYAVTIIGAATAVMSQMGYGVAAIGVASSVVATAYEIKMHKNKEDIERKINNLSVDISIENIEKNNSIEEKRIASKEKEENNIYEEEYLKTLFDSIYNTDEEEKAKTYYKTKRD